MKSLGIVCLNVTILEECLNYSWEGGNFRRSILLALHALVSQWERRKGKMDMFYTFFTFYTFTHFTRVGHKEIRQSDCTRWRRRGRVMRAPCDNHFFAV